MDALAFLLPDPADFPFDFEDCPMTDPKIEIVFDDIFMQDVDVIVNPANMYMLHGGGLARVIAYKGGTELVKESQAKTPVPTGSAITTTAGDLPFMAVIHTVGPRWDDDEPEVMDDQLASAYKSAMDECAVNQCKTIAFPAVSCGVFRFPVERAAPIAIKALKQSLEEHPEIERVLICVLEEEHNEAFTNALEEDTTSI